MSISVLRRLHVRALCCRFLALVEDSAVESYGTSDQGVRLLCAHILILALKDLYKPDQCESAEAFLGSDHLDLITEVLELNPEHVRQQVTEGIDPGLLKCDRRARRAANGGILARRAASIRTRTHDQLSSEDRVE